MRKDCDHRIVYHQRKIGGYNFSSSNVRINTIIIVPEAVLLLFCGRER